LIPSDHTAQALTEALRPGIKSTNFKESGKTLKRKPDLMLILMAVFGMGVVVTLMLPMAATDSVAAPASELQAGVIIRD